MGALTSNRKRGDDYFSLNYKNSPLFDGHTAKRARIERSSNQTPNSENPLKSAFYRIFLRYPESKSQIKREVHAPISSSKFRPFGGSRNCEPRDSERSYFFPNTMGNFLSSRYENTRRDALETCRYIKKDKEVIEVDDKTISEDSSIEEVEVLAGPGNQKGKDSNVDVKDFKKYDGKVMDGDFYRSSLSAVTNVSDGTSKMETTGMLLESLTLSEEGGSAHKKLLDYAERRNDKLKSLEFQIKLKEKELQRRQLLRPQKKQEVEVINKVT